MGGALGGDGCLAFLLRGHLLDDVLVLERLASKRGLVERDLPVGDLALLLSRRLLGLLGFLHDREELDAREGLQLFVARLVLCFLELSFNELEHLADLGKCLVWAEVRYQETLPARGYVIGIGNTVLVLLRESILLSFT